MIKNFSELVKALETATFEEIVSKYFQEKYADVCNVECSENAAYEDDDLISFLAELDAEIIEYSKGYVIICAENQGNRAYYKVESEDRPNRFGDDLPYETILAFDSIEKCNPIAEDEEECELTEKDLEFPEKPTGRKAYRRKKTAKRKKRIRDRLVRSDSKSDAKSVSMDRYESCREKKKYKKLANRKLRHSMNVPMVGNGYRKNFEVQWEID